MTEHDDTRRTDTPLDSILRAIARETDPGAAALEPDDLLDYLDGSAAQETAALVRAGLARSAEARRLMRDAAEDLDRLASPAAAAAFAAEPSPAAPDRAAFLGEAEASPSPRSLFDQLADRWDDLRSSLSALGQGFFLRPAYATATTLAVLLMAYPAYKYVSVADRTGAPVSGPGAVTGAVDSPVLAIQHLHLRPAVNLRGEESGTRAVVEPAAAGSVIDLSLWSFTPLAPGARVAVSVRGADEVLWSSDDFRDLGETPADPTYRLLLSRDTLAPGAIDIEIVRYDRETGVELLRETFSCELR